MGVTLDGQEAVLRKLTDLLTDTRYGESTASRALVVEGHTGVGKTYVLREAVGIARDLGFHLVGPIEGRDLTVGTACWRPSSRQGPLEGSQLPADEADVPVLVTVDDAHLIDPDQLRMEMRWLSRSYRPPSVWVITTHPLSQPAAVAADEVVYGSLSDLDESAVIDLVTGLLGAPPGPALAALVAQADGNPQLITELLDGLREEGGLCAEQGTVEATRTGIPQRVTRLVRHRLNALSPACRRMLQVAAALGRELRVAAVAEAMAEPVNHLLPLLEEAGEAGLLTSDGPELAFRSPLLWRAVRACVPVYVHAVLSQEDCPPDTDTAFDPAWNSLSDKERTIARLAGEGLTNQQIAHRVYLSPHTVNYYLRRIFRKLGVGSRIELAKVILAGNDGLAT